MGLAKKIVILGHFGVGKTSLIRKFVTDEFSTDYKVTIGVHVLKKEVIINATPISLVLWDLEGTDNLQKINSAYLLGSHAFIYVFDVKRPSTYKNLEIDINFLKKSYNIDTIKIVGNKVDLISEEEYKAIKALETPPSFFSSAKTGENIETIFNQIATDLL